MKKVSVLFLTLIFLQIICSCSSSFSEKDLDELNVKVRDIESWINLMPGDPGSFHITGKYEFPEQLDEKKIFLDKIIVADNENEIYTLFAELQFVNNSTKGFKEFTFTNNYQTKIDPILMHKDNVDIQLIFSVNGALVKKNFNKIPLTRAY